MFAFITMCFFYISPLLSGGFAGQVDQSMCSCSSQDDTARVSVQNQFVEVAEPREWDVDLDGVEGIILCFQSRNEPNPVRIRAL